jgi:molybdopterin synthase catalytic subunit
VWRSMGSDWIQLQAAAIDASKVIAFVTAPSAGGIAIFLGTTRAETSKEGTSLIALDYDAYAEMAQRQMEQLAAGARERWPVERLAILHRTGRVYVGEPSVVIGVSTGHRAQAFEACRWIIDTLKAEVAIWKKEVWEDGSMSWVEGVSGRRGEGKTGGNSNDEIRIPNQIRNSNEK